MRYDWPVFLLVLLMPALAAAENASVDASARPDVVEVGDTFNYMVSASVQGDDPIRLVRSPDFGPFDRVSQRRMPQLININGRTTRRLTMTYSLRAPRTGEFEIRPPTVQIGDQRMKPAAVSVSVVARGKAPDARPRTRNKKYFIDVDVSPEEPPYVGEQVTLSWHLFVDGTRFDVRPTSTHDPSLDAFWVEPIPTQDQDRIVTNDGRLMRQIPLWRYAAFPLNSGPIMVEPVEVEVMVGTFTRRKTTHVKSEPIELEVKPLPPDAPRGFNEGNVGVFNFNVLVEPNVSRVGGNVTVKVQVSGSGHLARIEVPRLPDLPNMRVSDVDEETNDRVRNDRVGGVKTRIYHLMPLEEGTVTIPELEFAYFDTRQEEYVTRRSRPVTLKIRPGELPPEPVKPSKLAKRNVSGGEDLVEKLMGQLQPPRDEVSLEGARDPSKFPWPYWVLGAGSFLLFLGAAFRPRLEQLRKRSAPERQRESANREVFQLLDEAGDDPDAIYKALRDWLSSAFDIPRGAITASDLPGAFAKRGMDPEAADRLAAVLGKCEKARFTPHGTDTSALAAQAREVAEWLQKSHDVNSATTVSLVLSAVLLVAATSFASDASVDTAVQAQNDERWADATQAWSAVAERNPAAVDVWYNLGTTAARADDWATARRALERAAYLAPLDSDIGTNRDIVARIVRLHAIERSRTGRTMEGDEVLFWWDIAAHVDAHVAGILLIVFWLLAAWLIVVRRRTDSAAIRDAAFVGLVLAILLGCAATFGVAARARLLAETEPVVLVEEDLELREGPNAAAKLKRVPTTLVPGTLLRASSRREGWVKLEWHDDAGWTPTASVSPVVDPD